MKCNGIGCAGWGALLVLAGCATPRMAPPADVAGASEILTVSDRSRASGALVNESFKLGSYDVADVNRDWDSKSSTGVGPWSKESKTTGFAFALKGQGKQLKGKCESEQKSNSILGLGGGAISWGDLKIACMCEGEGAKSELVMTNDARTLKLGDKKYKVQPIHDLEGGKTQSEPSGFRADSDGLLGAVEVQYPGQIWLKRGLDDATKMQASCIFAGLMLYQPPKDH